MFAAEIEARREPGSEKGEEMRGKKRNRRKRRRTGSTGSNSGGRRRRRRRRRRRTGKKCSRVRLNDHVTVTKRQTLLEVEKNAGVRGRDGERREKMERDRGQECRRTSGRRAKKPPVRYQ